MAYNSDLFSLANWKLTLPVDASNGIGGTAVEVKNLVGYENSQSFYDAPDGAMVFRAEVDGATTSGSKYARSELREMNGTERAAWTLKEGGTMTATLKVDEVPTKSDGSPGRVVVGQIHGQDEELVRLYFENGSVHFVNDQAGSGNQETTFQLLDAEGKQPNISLNETFSYKIDAHGDTLTVSVYADDRVYSSATKINSVWQSDSFYFKAGVYLGVNETGGHDTGQTSFYGLDFSHAAGGGLAGLKDIVGPPSAPSQPAGTPSEPAIPAIIGTSKADQLAGTLGGEALNGAAGDDTLIGGAGDDTLSGGSGKDRFVFDVGHGHDTVLDASKGDVLSFDASLFRSAADVRAAMTQISAGVVLDTGSNSDIFFTGGKLADLQKLDIVITGAEQPTPGSGTPTSPTAPTSPAPADAVLSLSGTKGRDNLDGAGGSDTLKGENGDDVLQGHAGNDTLWGNGGKDRLDGGTGDDWLKGGDGHDTYVFSAGHGHDTIVELRGADTLIFADGTFDSEKEARAALHQTDAGLELHTGDGSSILFLGTNLQEVSHADWIVG